jgi:hypothetical protein
MNQLKLVFFINDNVGAIAIGEWFSFSWWNSQGQYALLSHCQWGSSSLSIGSRSFIFA